MFTSPMITSFSLRGYGEQCEVRLVYSPNEELS